MPAAKKTATASKGAAKTGEFTQQKFKDFTITKKRSGRFEVIGKNGKNVNGVDKAKILVEAKLVQASFTKSEAKDGGEAPTA